MLGGKVPPGYWTGTRKADDMKRWDGMVEGYLKRCEQRGLSECTRYMILRECERLGCWLKRRRPKVVLEEVSGEMLVEYVKKSTQFNARATVVSVVSRVRCLGDYLLEEGVWTKNPMRWVRGPKLDPRGRLPRRIGKGELVKLWDATGVRRSQYQQHVAMAVLALLHGTGLRRGELERLDLEDWKREEGVLVIDGRKTGRERAVPVSEGMWRCVEAYLPRRHNLLEKVGRLEEKALLVSQKGTRMQGIGVALMLRRLAVAAGIGRVTPHQFRHTCASDLLESGVSLPAVKEVLGHACVTTTVRYLQVADPARAAAVERHPLNDYLGKEQKEGRAA
jgi:integrase/recombinase XerD